MKKTIAILILLAMAAALFIGCSPSAPSTDGTPTLGDDIQKPGDDNDSGKETYELDPESLVKLLLAEERLNTALLKNQGDIFEDGAEVMNNLAAKAMDSVDYVSEYKAETTDIVKLSSAGEEVIFDNSLGGGKVTFDGETYLFSDFAELSNSYDSFAGTARYIAQMAEDAALMIDSIKKNVRIVDKWILIDGFTEYYLHVGENEEILYERTKYDYKICKRYVNEDGNNVYEFLRRDFSRSFTDKLTYIPGLHFETARGIYADGGFEQPDYLICDNTKGYWESYWVSPYTTHVNVSYMVMKDDICYDSFYDPAEQVTTFLKIISADKTADIFWYQGRETYERVEFDVHFSGFDNIKGVECGEIMMAEMGGELGSVPLPNVSGENNGLVLVLTNGKTIRVGDTFLDGKVEVSAIRVSMSYPHYTGSLAIQITAPTVEEKLGIFKEFLNEVGFTGRHDLDEVISGVSRAFDELGEITKYHVWNGLNQATEENVRKAIDIENEKTVSFLSLYNTVKDAEVVDFSDKVAAELNAHFAQAAVADSRDTVHSGLNIAIGALTLSVSDTFLFVENQAYTVNFALACEAGLVHLKKKTGSGAASFTESNGFSVTVEGVTLDIPSLVDGEYTLVAYIATDEGVRSSAYTAVPFDTVDTESENMIGKTRLTVKKADGDAIVLTYTTVVDVYEKLMREGAMNYEDLYTFIAGIACEHGIPSGSAIEMLTDSENETYTAMTGSEAEITDGTYRLAYNVQNGEKTANGFIYVALTVIPPAETA